MPPATTQDLRKMRKLTDRNQGFRYVRPHSAIWEYYFDDNEALMDAELDEVERAAYQQWLDRRFDDLD